MDKLLLVTAQVMKNYRIKNKKKGLPSTVSEVAQLMEITPNMLTHYEKGDRKIQLDLWYRWCNALQITHRSAIEKINYELRKQNAQNEAK